MKNKVITSQGNVQFIFPDGKIVNVHPNHIYTAFNEDTVSFILVALPKSSGLALMTSKAEDLELNGETYSFAELPAAMSEAFAIAGAQARCEIVDELPETGYTNTIYLVPQPSPQTGFDEYVYVDGEWELIGDTSIEMENYVTKTVFSGYTASTAAELSGKAEVVEITQANYDLLPSSAKTDASKLYVISDALPIDLSVYAKTSAVTSADTALDNKINAVSGATDAALALKQNILTAGAGIDITSDVISVTGSTGGITSGEVQTMIDSSISGKANSSDVYLKSETSGATEISTAMAEKLAVSDFNTYSGAVDTAINSKASESDLTGHTSNANIHVTTAQTAAWDAKSDFSGSYNDLTNKLSAGTNVTIVDNVISAEGGGKAIEAGRGISVTTGETADTVSFDLPISATTNGSILIGESCSANNNKSFVGGYASVGQGESSFAFGQNCKSGQRSIAVGDHVEANVIPNASAFGKYNKQTGGYFEPGSATTLFSVGNGGFDESGHIARHNAFEVRQNGDIYITKDGSDVKLQDQLGSSIEVSSAITSGDTNPVKGGALYDELRIVDNISQRTQLIWADGGDGVYCFNLPSNCYKVEFVGGNENANVNITVNATKSLVADWSGNTWTVSDISQGLTTIIDGSKLTLISTVAFNSIVSAYYSWSYDTTSYGIVESSSVTPLIDKVKEDEQVTAAALNELNARIAALEAIIQNMNN